MGNLTKYQNQKGFLILKKGNLSLMVDQGSPKDANRVVEWHNLCLMNKEKTLKGKSTPKTL